MLESILLSNAAFDAVTVMCMGYMLIVGAAAVMFCAKMLVWFFQGEEKEETVCMVECEERIPNRRAMFYTIED